MLFGKKKQDENEEVTDNKLMGADVETEEGFAMGIRALYTLQDTEDLVVVGRVEGTVRVGDAVYISNPGEDDSYQFVTTVLGIETGPNTRVKEASGCQAALRVERASRYQTKPGSVVSTRTCSEKSVHQAYITALGDAYATAFYGYAELWVLLPVTLVTGFMFTGFTFEWAPELPFLRKYPVRREAVCIAAMAVLLFLCGTLSVMPVKTQVASMGHVLPKETEEILEEYVCDGIPEGEKVWLLAPDDIMAYARTYDGRICLPYGRFLWEKELSAYTYDSYAADTEELHGWVNGTLTGMDEVEISENYLSMCSSKEITVLVFEKERLTADGLAEALDKQDSYRS